MTTPLENRITAALDQMARAAIPDEEVDQAGTSFGSRRTARNDRPSGSRRLLAVAASTVLICAGVVAIVSWNERAPESTSLVAIAPSAPEAPQSPSTPSEPTPSGVEPTAPDAAAALVWMIDPAVAGSLPLRRNHLLEWVQEGSWVERGSQPVPTYAYRVAPDGTFDTTSWRVLSIQEWYGGASDLPSADGVTSLDGLEVRRQVEGDRVNLIVARSNGDDVPDGVSITIRADQEAALSAWIQAVAGLVQANGAGAAELIVAPEGYTVMAEVAKPVTLSYATGRSPESAVTTRKFSGSVDPKAWIAAAYPDQSITDSVDVGTGPAWRLSLSTENPPDDAGDHFVTVVWQPASDTIVELNTRSDPDTMLRSLVLVPLNDPSILESSFLPLPSGRRTAPTQVMVELKGETPIGRFGYQQWEDNGLLCNVLMFNAGGGGGSCDVATPETQAPNAICALYSGWTTALGADAIALVNPADAGFVEIRRSADDPNPVTPEVFTGEFNGVEWALVRVHFDDLPASSMPDIRFTGGACQGKSLPDSATSSDDLAFSPVAIGDELMLALEPILTDRGYRVDAVANRQLSEMIEPLRQMVAKPPVGDPLVIELGTNGPFTEQEYRSLLSVLSEVPNVVVLTVHGDRPWVAENNRIIAANDRPYDNVIVLDWDGLAADCPGDCFADDGVHLTATGAQYLADQIQNVTGW